MHLLPPRLSRRDAAQQSGEGERGGAMPMDGVAVCLLPRQHAIRDAPQQRGGRAGRSRALLTRLLELPLRWRRHPPCGCARRRQRCRPPWALGQCAGRGRALLTRSWRCPCAGATATHAAENLGRQRYHLPLGLGAACGAALRKGHPSRADAQSFVPLARPPATPLWGVLRGGGCRPTGPRRGRRGWAAWAASSPRGSCSGEASCPPGRL